MREDTEERTEKRHSGVWGVWRIIDHKKERERLNGRGGMRREREAGVHTGNRR